MILFLLLLIHIVGAILTIIYFIKTGVFKDAKKYGDGIRIAKPSDVLFQTVIIWEVLLIIKIFEFIDYKIDNINW